MGSAAHLRGLGDLVSLAYDGIDEPTLWKTLMGQLSEATESHDASMVISSAAVPGGYLLVTDNDDPHLTGNEHVKGVMSVNVLLDIAQPCASTPEELMPDGAFFRTTLYQQFLKPNNLRYLLALDVVRDEVLRVKLSLERTGDQGPYSKRERDVLEFITPHLQRAIRLREHKDDGLHMRFFFEEAMAKLAIGCLMLDARGRVVSINAWARRLIEQNDALSVRNARLRAVDTVDGRALNKAVEAAQASRRAGGPSFRGTGLRLESAPGMSVLDIVVKPLARDSLLESDAAPTVVIYINDCRRPGIELDPAALTAMYGLTHCESQIGALLAKGTCLSDVATRLHVSINTVKTHLRGIYEKLGTSKQAQVVARLNHSSARLL